MDEIYLIKGPINFGGKFEFKSYLSYYNCILHKFLFSVTAEHLFAENKEKQINAALMALITKDMPPDDLQGMNMIY